jgi:hypothetical protein
MNMNYAMLQNKPRVLQSLTGLNRDEFETLLESFEVAWKQFIEVTFQREGRKRACGG